MRITHTRLWLVEQRKLIDCTVLKLPLLHGKPRDGNLSTSTLKSKIHAITEALNWLSTNTRPISHQGTQNTIRYSYTGHYSRFNWEDHFWPNTRKEMHCTFRNPGQKLVEQRKPIKPPYRGIGEENLSPPNEKRYGSLGRNPSTEALNWFSTTQDQHPQKNLVVLCEALIPNRGSLNNLNLSDAVASQMTQSLGKRTGIGLFIEVSLRLPNHTTVFQAITESVNSSSGHYRSFDWENHFWLNTRKELSCIVRQPNPGQRLAKQRRPVENAICRLLPHGRFKVRGDNETLKCNNSNDSNLGRKKN